MMKKRCSIVLSIVVISIFLCSGSFAQNDLVPDHLLEGYKVVVDEDPDPKEKEPIPRIGNG